MQQLKLCFLVPQLYVNTEMCVNTLMKECTTFLLDHSTDGRNYSSRYAVFLDYSTDGRNYPSRYTVLLDYSTDGRNYSSRYTVRLDHSTDGKTFLAGIQYF